MSRWLSEFKEHGGNLRLAQREDSLEYNDEPIDFTRENEKAKMLLRKYGYVVIQSKALGGEVMVLARDEKAAQTAPPGLVVYTLAELRALIASPPDEAGLREMHGAKKMLGGTVCDPSNPMPPARRPRIEGNRRQSHHKKAEDEYWWQD